MSIVCNFVSQIKGGLFRFQSHPIVEMFTKVCVYFEPLTLFFASYIVVEFFYRVEIAFKSVHKSAHQKVNLFNLILTAAPPLISVFGIKAEDGLTSCFFGFTFVSSALSVLYPIIIQKTGHFIGSFFQITLLFGSLYYYQWRFMYFFLLSIPFAFILFKNEFLSSIDRFRKSFLAPFLVVMFFGVWVSYDDKPTIAATMSIYGGAFAALIIGNH